MSAAEFASAAVTKRAMRRSRWPAPIGSGPPAHGRPGRGGRAATSTSPAAIARAASDAVQPLSVSDRMATSTPIVSSSYRR